MNKSFADIQENYIYNSKDIGMISQNEAHIELKKKKSDNNNW